MLSHLAGAGLVGAADLAALPAATGGLACRSDAAGLLVAGRAAVGLAGEAGLATALPEVANGLAGARLPLLEAVLAGVLGEPG